MSSLAGMYKSIFYDNEQKIGFFKILKLNIPPYQIFLTSAYSIYMYHDKIIHRINIFDI